jgi:hypothetical protein
MQRHNATATTAFEFKDDSRTLVWQLTRARHIDTPRSVVGGLSPFRWWEGI